VSQGGCDKLIVNMVNSDHGMRETVVRITGPLAAESESERVAVPAAWNLCPPSREASLSRSEVVEAVDHQL